MVEKEAHCEATCPWCQLMKWTHESETFHHLRNARREMLLAVQSVVEAGLEKLERGKDEPIKPKAHKVEIN